MQLSQVFISFLLLVLPVSPVQGEPIPARDISPRAAPLVDYNAAKGDDPKKLGTLNLEKAKGDKPKGNTKDLYIKLDKDWKGTPAAHFHHKKGDRR